MIIPVRCFTCGKVISGKWKRFQELSAAADNEPNKEEPTIQQFDRGHKAAILKEIGVDKICCRRHILTHVDLVDML